MTARENNQGSKRARRGEPLATTAESLRLWRRNAYNPVRSLTPANLINALESFAYGDMREAARLWEVIAERDDILAGVKPKREKSVSQLDRKITLLDDGPEGQRHAEILQGFWDNVRAVNAYDRNERGGFRRLVRQMMTAVSYRYAAHHIIWQPGPGRLRATFEFVPLWLMENRTGRLRFLREPWATEGEELEAGEWMVTPGDGLMIACSVGYLAKRMAFNDWLAFSEKFSMPGVIGRTPHKKGTAEGEAVRAAVAAFGHDWSTVIYGDDGKTKDPIQLVQANGSSTAMPMPSVIERVDRRMTALYRGADLSTISSASGEGTGASLQGKEESVLKEDDAATINEVLEDVSRRVIEWWFGWGVEPLAKVELVVPANEDTAALLDSATRMADRGARVSKRNLMDRLGLQDAADEGDVLGQMARPGGNATGAPAPASVPAQRVPAANAAEAAQAARGGSAKDDLDPEIAAAHGRIMERWGETMWRAAKAGDTVALQAAIDKATEGETDDDGLADALEKLLVEEFAAGWEETEAVENSWRSEDHPRWPAGEESGAGGRFSPKDTDAEIRNAYRYAEK